MTDGQRITAIGARWNANGLGGLADADIADLIRIARAGLAKQPPPGSVEVRVAVACDSIGVVATLGVHRSFDPMARLREVCDMLSGPTHAAIVTAHIPPIVTPVVQGEVAG